MAQATKIKQTRTADSELVSTTQEPKLTPAERKRLTELVDSAPPSPTTALRAAFNKRRR